MSNSTIRFNGRDQDALRPICFESHIAPNALGSVKVSFGNTQVICAATLEKKIPTWLLKESPERGWVTAEYSMLPYSTLERKSREVNKGKQEGRTVEIQRLIGRALRAVLNLKKLTGYTLWLDCDVLQADGGTRTASITGVYLAAKLAIRKALQFNMIKEDPFIDSIAAISVGICDDHILLDLNYHEDKDAYVDSNIVMTGSGNFVEIQSAGEEHAFSPDQLTQLIAMGQKGLKRISQYQQQFLEMIIGDMPTIFKVGNE